MKSVKSILVLLVMVAFSFTAKADYDQVITYNQLPAVAQTMLKTYFADRVPLVVTMDWDDYTVRYESGEKVEFDDGLFYGFPKPNQFLDFYETPIEEADADGHCYEIDCYTRNLKSCGVGYRAPYMKNASKMILEDIDIDGIFGLDYEDAFDLILGLPGVGPKVADCILLYGFGFEEAFPSDVWIKRIVSHLYFDGEEISADKTRDFGIEHFGDYAGYAQLYLFHYARKSGLMEKIKK